MKMILALGALLALAPLTLAAQQSTPPAPPSAPAGFEIPKDMTTYYVALYVRGPRYMAAESPERTALIQRHLKYIRRMIEQHRYLLAGPLLDGGDKQGLAIISAPNAEEAKRIADGDPAIASGHMAVELHPAMLPSLSTLVITY